MCCVFKQKRDEGQLSVRTRGGGWTSGGRDPVKAFLPTTLAPVHVSYALLKNQRTNEKQPP